MAWAHSTGATISFDLATRQRVSVKIYDVLGHLIRTLVSDREFSAGGQRLVWDGASDSGTPASVGIYFIQVVGAGTSAARRVAILR